MNKLVVFFSCLLCISSISFSQFKLDIEIAEIRNNNGNIMLQLFDEHEKVLTQDKNRFRRINAYFLFRISNPGNMLSGITMMKT